MNPHLSPDLSLGPKSLSRIHVREERKVVFDRGTGVGYAQESHELSLYNSATMIWLLSVLGQTIRQPFWGL